MAALFYGQAQASAEDVAKLTALLHLPRAEAVAQMTGFPDRGRAGPMPPVEPLIYRLYEIVQNYGYAYKAVLNEKFGDGIMSAISFSSKVEKEVDESGAPWVVITLRGKWYVVWSSFFSSGSVSIRLVSSLRPCSPAEFRLPFLFPACLALFLLFNIGTDNSRLPFTRF